MKKRTIKSECYAKGIGGITGLPINLVLKPAPVNTGIVFVRTDIPNCRIKIQPKAIKDTTLNTSISNENGDYIFIVEHILATFWVYEITDIIVEIDGPEIPLMDGSSDHFCFMINTVGIHNYDDINLDILKINETIKIEKPNTDSYIIAEPYPYLYIDYTIEYPEKTIGKDRFIFDSSQMSFLEELSMARTFCTEKEIDFRHNFAKGWSLHNSVIYGDEKVICFNNGDLIYQNEATRHKILDLIGDLMLTGHFVLGKFTCYKSGHYLNSKIVEKISQNVK